MKPKFKILSILTFLVVCVIVILGSPVAAAGMALAAPPVVLDTQKITFLTSLKEEYEAIDTWLNEVQDLSAFVEDGQTLVFPEGGEAPAVYKNRTTDIDSVEPEEDTNKVSLDVYDSQNYKLRSIYMYGLPFPKLQYYTKKSSDSIVKQEIADAAYAFSPDRETRKCIVIPTTGSTRGIYKMMQLDDVVTLARACDNAQFPSDGRNLVLPADMWWDLVNNNSILKGQLERMPLNGIIVPLVVEYYGFKIHKSVQDLNIGYDLISKAKAPQDTIITGDIVPAGFLFISEMTFKAGGSFDMFMKNKAQNPEGRADVFGFQHRFKADHQMKGQRYSALIYQDKA
ncbi:hypothetical protein [Dysgonomonas sp. 520]|uniref:hypothetical protein n=1 Tax=Dysgonomonas sp. 520 TaxID=2302931 RepID=UPI0013D5A47A|nr:hypothetical protein [Dysgonomonas sp. 520]NDW10458.1 hypothetical protein [Dysgonomonas sp. 520]